MDFRNGQMLVLLLVILHSLACVVTVNTEDSKGFENEWQLTKLTLQERNSFMFNNSFMSDVKFVPRGCGPDEAIYAHKYMLATSSSVFYEFFYGKLAKRNEFSYDMGTYITTKVMLS